MARPLLRGDRLQAAREAMRLTREELATRLDLSSPARIRVWELGLERPRPRFIPLAGRHAGGGSPQYPLPPRPAGVGRRRETRPAPVRPGGRVRGGERVGGQH